MNTLIRQFNKFGVENQSLIQKALTSTAGVGEGLIPQQLEKIITDTVIRLSPELSMMVAVQSAGKTHEFNRKTALPAPGGVMGENATTPATNSKTVRDSVTLKVIRKRGVVTNFLNDTSRQYIDSTAYEIQNILQSHVLDMINQIYYGNKDSNSYEFDGWDKSIVTNRTNKARGGVVPTALETLDAMIDASDRKRGFEHKRSFLMSPEMISKFSQLLTNVRLNQGVSGSGMTQVTLNGGWRVGAYRDIPIIPTTSTRPIEKMRPTITLAGATGVAGGALSNGDFKVQIAPITYEGEQEASTEQSITLSGGGSTQSIRIQLSDIHKDSAGNANAYAYKIYCSATTGTEVLVKIVPAFVYDSAGTPSAITTNFNGDASNYIYIHTLTPGADVPAGMQSDVPLVATGGVRPEVIGLIDFDPIQGLGKLPYANTSGDMFNGLVTIKPLAEIDDYIHFLVKSYCALAPAFEATSVWVRGLRTL